MKIWYSENNGKYNGSFLHSFCIIGYMRYHCWFVGKVFSFKNRTNARHRLYHANVIAIRFILEQVQRRTNCRIINNSFASKYGDRHFMVLTVLLNKLERFIYIHSQPRVLPTIFSSKGNFLRRFIIQNDSESLDQPL
jgi:hypothetical protein